MLECLAKPCAPRRSATIIGELTVQVSGMLKLILTLVFAATAMLAGAAQAKGIDGFSDEAGFSLKLSQETVPVGVQLCDIDSNPAAGLEQTYVIMCDLKLGGELRQGCVLQLKYNYALIDIKLMVPPGGWTLPGAFDYCRQAYPRCVYSTEEEPYRGKVMTVREAVRNAAGEFVPDEMSATWVEVYELQEEVERWIIVHVTAGVND